jgi:tRNA threonylcarbamoyl adenosine modification protein YeaZ
MVSLVTCGPQLEVALWAPSMVATSLVRLGGTAPRSTLVLAGVDLLVEDAGLQPSDVATVVVSRGPGSFTGIRAGLATASGIAAATGARVVSYDSLIMLAARCDDENELWAAQPGRRGEVYARRYSVDRGRVPQATSQIEIRTLKDLERDGPWIAAEALDLGPVPRAPAGRSSAEALMHLLRLGATGEAPEPLYVEGPPVHRRATDS